MDKEGFYTIRLFVMIVVMALNLTWMGWMTLKLHQIAEALAVN